MVSNFFVAYKEGDKYYLLDGFNRLFTNYGKIEINTPVYLKLITTKLEDYKLMQIMYRLNLWKLSDNYHNGGFKSKDFLERGLRLLFYFKFGIEFYERPDNILYKDRKKEFDDFHVLDYYFIDEKDFAGYFKTSYAGVGVLFSQENIINDIREIVKINSYSESEKPFKNYDMFVEGFIMYMSYLRRNGYTKKIEFEFFLTNLLKNKDLSKKLPSMSGNESTRKNIYRFYRNFDVDLLFSK